MKFNNFTDLKNDMKENPNKYLDDQGRVSLVGEQTTAYCPICNSNQTIEILEGGVGKCLSCNHNLSTDFQ